jgi:glycosyltransferase involved in cell wall biosynthesis
VIVHQWVPSAHVGDAVGDHAQRLRALLRAWGHESDIFAINIDDALAGDVLPWSSPRAREGDVTLLHFAAASEMSASLGRLPGRRVVYFHNITPARFFSSYDAGLARLAHESRRQLAALAPHVDLALAASDFSRAELDRLGFARTAVLPILLDLDPLRHAPAVPALERLLDDGLANILFVGRLAPNKRLDDHLRLAEHYKRYVDAAYRFIFVGRHDAVPGYYAALRRMVATYRMLPERFWFPGAVPVAELAAYYRHAHAYVSLSEHEGFGVPLLEAMAMDVPVLAYADTAVPETLGGAGVAFRPKDLELAAELLGALIYDEPFRDAVIDGQRRRVRDFAPDRLAGAYRNALAEVTS